MISLFPFPGGQGLRRSIPRLRKRAAFTLVEMLVSVSVLALLLMVLTAVTESASRAWREGQSRTDTFQSARTALELMARELAPAVVDTRMQFVVAPNSLLAATVRSGPKANFDLAEQFAPGSPAILWMAPLGEDGGLRCVGYYLHRDKEHKFYRLKRIYIEPPVPNQEQKDYFPRIYGQTGTDALDDSQRTSPIKATWFTGVTNGLRSWDAPAFDEQDKNGHPFVSSAADGVIAFWVQCYDVLGNPIPLLSKAKNHPTSTLYYNSAAYFQMATTTAFENNAGSFVYLAQTPQSMKANKVPAAVEITLVTLDSASIAHSREIPEQTSPIANGLLDVDTALADFETALQNNGIRTARVFKTRARLINGN